MRVLRCSIVSALSILLTSACAADSNGEWCGFLDQGFDDDKSYCPDPDAPEKCEEIRDELLDKIDACAQASGLELTEQQLEDAGDELDCESAKAIRDEEADCKDDLDSADCNDTGLFDLPESCKGVVLTW
jgi:hypothetical protein